MNADHPKRKPTRLKNFDYSQNRAFFVTVCTQERSEILADICRGGALLLPIGKIVDREIKGLSQRYAVRVDKYVIMPNHIHMILLLRNHLHENAASVTGVLCALKSRTTKLSNEMEGKPGRKIWQRSFHDHIIRDEEDYLKIWRYIDENPMRWEKDCFYQKSDLLEERIETSEK